MGVWLKIIKSSSLQWVRHCWKWFQLRGPVGSCRLLSHVWATLKVADSLPQFHCLILLEYLCICSRKMFAEYWQFILSSWKNDPNKNPRLKHARMNIHSTWALSFCGHNRGKKTPPNQKKNTVYPWVSDMNILEYPQATLKLGASPHIFPRPHHGAQDPAHGFHAGCQGLRSRGLARSQGWGWHDRQKVVGKPCKTSLVGDYANGIPGFTLICFLEIWYDMGFSGSFCPVLEKDINN